ncbi:hypothetical protein ACFX15_034567 [Malus domestica]
MAASPRVTLPCVPADLLSFLRLCELPKGQPLSPSRCSKAAFSLIFLSCPASLSSISPRTDLSSLALFHSAQRRLFPFPHSPCYLLPKAAYFVPPTAKAARSCLFFSLPRLMPHPPH